MRTFNFREIDHPARQAAVEKMLPLDDDDTPTETFDVGHVTACQENRRLGVISVMLLRKPAGPTFGSDDVRSTRSAHPEKNTLGLCNKEAISSIFIRSPGATVFARNHYV